MSHFTSLQIDMPVLVATHWLVPATVAILGECCTFVYMLPLDEFENLAFILQTLSL